MANPSADITQVATAATDLDLSLFGLIMQSDAVVKTVMLMLMLASVWCWAIVFDKWRYFKTVGKKMKRFEKDYHASKLFDPLYNKVKNQQDNPMASMFVSGMFELKQGALKGVSKPTVEQKNFARERIYFTVQRVKNKAVDKMQSQLIILATIGSSAPFIGLFGTVWGIVNSFQAIGISKNTTLAVVAPGIAEALLATAIGLFAAIPAVIFYNIFSNKISIASEKLEDFSNELSTLLTHQIGK